MATLVANATASLTANGTSTATGSITWTVPTLPSGVSSWDSIVISGSWSWTGKGNITRVTINGTNTSAGTTFSVNINGKTSPLSITCVGNNKNATGANFKWTNLIITYTYTPPSSAAYIKQGGTWRESVLYEKRNGAWIEITDLSTIDTTKHYIIN